MVVESLQGLTLMVKDYQSITLYDREKEKFEIMGKTHKNNS